MNKLIWILVVCVLILLDQLTKLYMLQTLALYDSIILTPFMNLTLVYNTGTAFGFLHNAGAWHLWFFLGFSAVMCVILAVWLRQTPKTAYLQLTALSLIMGGAIGNLIDRLRLGHVIDFIDLHYQNYYWPVFNVADSIICIGACLLFIQLLKREAVCPQDSKH